LWAFLGIESATIPADNVRDPKRTLPRATYLGVAIVAIIYGMTSLVVFGVMSNAELASSSGPFADAATKMWGSWAGVAMVAVAVVSTLGSINGNTLLAGQMPRAAALDQLFPSWFAKLNKAGSPANGIILSAIFSTALVLLNISESTIGLFNFSILLSTTTLLVPYIFCSVAAFRLQQDQDERWPVISGIIFAIAFLFSMWALGGSGKDAVYWGFILMMVSVPVYVAIKSTRERE
jgi:APA family basic amino acid/polyamine antiporter